MMKNFIRIVLKDGSYTFKAADTVEMGILGCFLASDVGCYSASFKEWALYDQDTLTGGNITDLEKDGDDILLNDQYSEQPDKGPYFRIPKQQFIKLFDEWEKICKEKPQEVLIEWDGKCFAVQAKQ
jgi:hypothetical protein